MIWIVVAQGKDIGLSITAYDNPQRAIKVAKDWMARAVKHLNMDRPDEVRVDLDPWHHHATAPYWARIVDRLEITVYRKEVRRGSK
jgi:hypothetical protein